MQLYVSSQLPTQGMSVILAERNLKLSETPSRLALLDIRNPDHIQQRSDTLVIVLNLYISNHTEYHSFYIATSSYIHRTIHTTLLTWQECNQDSAPKSTESRKEEKKVQKSIGHFKPC